MAWAKESQFLVKGLNVLAFILGQVNRAQLTLGMDGSVAIQISKKPEQTELRNRKPLYNLIKSVLW